MSTELSLFKIQYNGEVKVVRAEGRNAIKEHVLKTISFEATKATAEDVLEFSSNGGKVETIKSE